MSSIMHFKIPAQDIIIRMGNDAERLANIAFEELNNIKLIDDRNHEICGYVALKRLIFRLESQVNAMLTYEQAKFINKKRILPGSAGI